MLFKPIMAGWMVQCRLTLIVNVEENGSAIYSDLDFNILQEREADGQQQMKLKLKRGKVKMKLEAGLGTVYLRKK